MNFNEKNTYLKRFTLYDKSYDIHFDVFDWHVGKLTIRIGKKEGEYLKKYFGVKEK